MRRIKFNLATSNLGTWQKTVKLTENYLSKPIKANQLLNAFSEGFSDRERTVCQALFLGALRNGHRIKAALKPFIQRNPRKLIEAILLITGYEILSGTPEKTPQIIHHSVESSKQLVKESEIGLLNALLRKLPDALNAVHADNRPDIFFSHPKWLFKRWNKTFGLPATIQLMEWNQTIPENYLRFYDPAPVSSEVLEPTQWNGFYKVLPGTSWQQDIQPLLNNGSAYVKDPSTRLAADLLTPKKGEHVLDLCAAPGGKAYDLAHLMELEGLLIALDLPGNRVKHLRKNLKQLANVAGESLSCPILEVDLLKLSNQHFVERKLPSHYDAVLLDAPCSNTGVIRRRTDVKWRLRPEDMELCADLQKKLIVSAARYVKPGGRLVYSTCSIDPDENQAVIEAFLKSKPGRCFRLKDSVVSLPWETGHDGAGAFLLISD